MQRGLCGVRGIRMVGNLAVDKEKRVRQLADPALMQAILQGTLVSAPMFIVLMNVITGEGYHKVISEEPFVLFSAFLSYASLILAAMNYLKYQQTRTTPIKRTSGLNW